MHTKTSETHTIFSLYYCADLQILWIGLADFRDRSKTETSETNSLYITDR